MRPSEQVPHSGVTVGRVDNDQDTQERVLGEHLEWLKRQLFPLLEKRKELEALLNGIKEAGRVLEGKARGVMLALGKSEKEVFEEMHSWRS